MVLFGGALGLWGLSRLFGSDALPLESQTYGLLDRRSSWVSKKRFQGIVGSQYFVVEHERDGELQVTTITVHVPKLARELVMESENTAVGAQKARVGEGVLTGDPVFDTHVRLAGPEDVALGVLDKRARSAVLELASKWGGVVKDARAQVRLTTPLDRRADVDPAIRTLIEVAEALKGGSAERSPRAAVEDPDPGVRRRALLVLGRADRKREEELVETAVRAMSAPDPSERAAADAALQESGEARAILEKVATDVRRSETVRAAALGRVLPLLTPEEAGGRVDEALGTGRPLLARVAVEAIGERRDKERLQVLCALAGAEDLALAVAVAESLGKLRDARAEGTVLAMLDRPEPEAQRAAVAALARIGTPRSVEALLRLSRGALVDSSLREEARTAIRWIQGRLTGEAGAVSLVGSGDEGALSVADTQVPEKQGG